jgi:probable rRNA maturation factor
VCAAPDLWKSHLPTLPSLYSLFNAVLELVAEVRSFSEVCLCFADDAEMAVYNARYRGQNKATNVLSFQADPEDYALSEQLPLGDIMVSFETVDREARLYEKPFPDHLAHLLVHGFLHLLGYVHDCPETAHRMQTLEKASLRSLGFAEPNFAPFSDYEPMILP